MDTLGNQARIEGFLVNLDQNGKQVTLLDSGKSFMALIRSDSDIDPGMPMGTDIREKNVVETLRSYIPAEVLAARAKSGIRATCDGSTMILNRRQDNVANPFVSFEVSKVI